MIRPLSEAHAIIRLMQHEDLMHVSDIERRSYDFPWSHGVFRDCLLAGYQCIVFEREGDVAGYAILSVAAGEAAAPLTLKKVDARVKTLLREKPYSVLETTVTKLGRSHFVVTQFHNFVEVQLHGKTVLFGVTQHPCVLVTTIFRRP